jgi:hypothetical protein
MKAKGTEYVRLLSKAAMNPLLVSIEVTLGLAELSVERPSSGNLTRGAVTATRAAMGSKKIKEP